MSRSPTVALQDPALPRLPLAGLGIAWSVFWLLMMTVAVQDHLRQGHTDLWKPLLWEGTSCVVASIIVALQWRRVHHHDRWLAQPWRWFGASLLWLPLAAPGFVTAAYGMRHAVHAALGQPYHHEAWGIVFRYESLKFSLFYLLFVAILFGMRSRAALSAERVRAERSRALSQQAQLLQLTQQIEPHFLFNALNTIAATIHTDPERADTLLTRLAALLRAATDLARQPEVALADELRLLEGYAAIMCERFAGRVDLHWDIDPHSTACRVPTLALQPLLENAFLHGVERRSQPTRVVVRSRRDGLRLLLEVEDDAGELPASQQFGIGLTNLQQRLALRFGVHAALTLSQRGAAGVLARIEMPCEC
jgi:hypothetical protein